MRTIQQEADTMVNNLASGDLSSIADLYAYPAAVYFGQDVLVFEGKADLLRALNVYHAILMSHGLKMVATSVIEKPDSEGERFFVVVANTYLDDAGAEIGTSRIRYYLQRENGCLKIRLVEYLDWPCKQDVADSDVLGERRSGVAAAVPQSRAPHSEARVLH